MKREYGVALKEFMRSRDYTTASPDLKKLYGEYKGWDNFIEEAKILGFKWNQIYFVKNLVESYNCEDVDNLKWLLLNILKKYDLGNLRSSIDSLNVLEDKVLDAQGIIDVNKEIFGIYNQPFTIENNYIYIKKIKKYEENFLNLLDQRLSYKSNSKPDMSVVVKSLENRMEYPLDGARLDAVTKALEGNFLIISGGPGTGKTTTVISIIRGLLTQGIDKIALAAPTGRAAKRVMESINNERVPEDIGMPTDAFTLHKLLGIMPNKDKPRYNSDRKLPIDALIVDEASMVDINMMYRLFDALNPETKLILVGDKDQLPSVEAGALLGDFLHDFRSSNHKMRNSIVLLDKSYRSIKGIMDGAKLIISGDSKKSLDYLKGDVEEIETKEIPMVDDLVKELINSYKTELNSFLVPVSEYDSVLGSIDELFTIFNNFAVLTPSKKGLYGTYSLNNMIKREFNPSFKPYYHGEPIMITKNDYVNKLYNGDRGVILNFTNGYYAFFRNETGFKILSISKILDYETAYVGTVHKSQGSEYNRVAIVIPEGSEKLLTREILYTAVTRAKKKVTIYAMDHEIITAVEGQIVRESGIKDFLVES